MPRRRTECWPRPRGRRLEAFVFALGVLLGCPPARGAPVETLRVAVIHHREDDVIRKLRAEVSAAGLVAVDVQERRDDERTTASLARAAHAPAAVRVRAEGELEVVIVGPDGETLYWDSLGATGNSSELSAIRAVELLRGRLVKLALLSSAPEPSKPGEPVPPGATSASPPVGPAPPSGSAAVNGVAARSSADRSSSTVTGARESVVWIDGGYGVAGGNGGLGLASVGRLGARWEPGGPWALSAFGLLPLSSQSVSNATGTAEVHVTILGVAGHYLLLPREGMFGVDLGIGAAGVIAAMTGHAATTDNLGRSETVGAAAALCEAAFTARITKWLRLRAEGLVGIAFPRPVVGFAGVNGASWGRPFEVLTLAVEVSTSGTRTP